MKTDPKGDYIILAVEDYKINLNSFDLALKYIESNKEVFFDSTI